MCKKTKDPLDAMIGECLKEYYRINNLETPMINSKKFRIKINRIFRDIVDSKDLPHPEVDNLYEKIRSKIVAKLKTLK